VCSVRHASDLEGSLGQYVLHLPPPEGPSGAVPLTGSQAEGRDDDVDENFCHLEVVRQGQYLGLRSASAGGRFLQPRRKHPHHLVFFNGNLGVWEQWEAVGEEADGVRPWSQTPLRLRSRRLPHVELRFDAARVGSYDGSALGDPRRGGTLTSVSEAPVSPYDEDDRVLQGSTSDIREDVQLMRINGLFAHEWTRYGRRCHWLTVLKSPQAWMKFPDLPK